MRTVADQPSNFRAETLALEHLQIVEAFDRLLGCRDHKDRADKHGRDGGPECDIFQ